MLTGRNRPEDCTWDVFQPANDAFLPPTIARSTDLGALAARLAHVEAYLKTLPPNFAMFRPLQPEAVRLGEEVSTEADPQPAGSSRKALTADADEGFSDASLPRNSRRALPEADATSCRRKMRL